MANETHAKGEAELLRLARVKFIATFNRNPVVGACAPGRVNLMGDHIDYCEGYVLPVALPFLTVIVGGYNNSRECRLWTRLETGKVLETKFLAPTSTSPLKPGDPAWANYVKGVVANFPGTVNGFDAVIMSDVPMGAGLSSSAAIEVATFSFLEALTSTQVDPIKRAQLCQKAEHEFPGMPCGIMDQYISSLGKKNHALLIDCRSLESKQIPLEIGDAVIMVINSNVKHKLTGSEYPQRRAQCQEAADKLGLPSLRSATTEHLQVLRDMDSDELLLKRAEHVINEIDYTLQVAGSLSKKDLNRAGEIMYKSHESLSKLMEVSCPELDELVEIIKGCSGVYGARMTGGGFGGCAVALVKNSHVNEVKSKILSEYARNPFFFTCQGDDGARILKL